MRQVDHRVDQLAVFFAQLHTTDKTAVDLEQGDRQAVQVHERRKTGAKVIQREAHAQAAQGVHGLAHQLVAAHHRGFGQFELKPPGIDAMLNDQPAQGRQQLAVLKLAKAQVDRHVQRRNAVLTQALHVAQGT